MSKTYILIAISLVILCSLYLYRLLSSKPQSPLPSTSVDIKGTSYSLEIAKTTIEHSKGLSGRQNLCPTCGMIFVFDKEGIYPFWMKDTLIPLDIIWLDKAGKVATIVTAYPEPGVSVLNLKHFSNASPAAYVIELNAGEASKLNLKIGDVINLSTL